MFFRNLTFFRFPTVLDFDAVKRELAGCALKPVGPLEISSRGFVSPLGSGNTELGHALAGEPWLWLTLGGEDKILPPAVLNDQLAKRLAAIEAEEGRKVGGRSRKRLRDDLVHELLPRAFVRSSRVDALIDSARRYLCVDTPSRKAAESVAGEIRHALGSFPALPLNSEVAPRVVMTGWIGGEPLPDGLVLGDEAILEDAAEQGSRASVIRQDLQGDEIAKLLEAGKQVTRLALKLDDHVSFVLGEDLVIRKFKLLDGALDKLQQGDGDDLLAELDARFALLASEVGRLFDVLAPALKISEAAS